MYLFLTCISLFVVAPTAGTYLQCLGSQDEKKIYLINNLSKDLLPPMESYDFERSALKALNDKFREKCKDFYEIEDSHFDNRVTETLKAIDKETKVINLWVREYNDYNPLVYAGDIVYQSIRISEPDLTDKEPEFIIDAWKNFEVRREQVIEKRIAKVVSNSIATINSGELVDFISSIQYYDIKNVTSRLSCVEQATKTTDLYIVLICFNEWKDCQTYYKPYSETLKFIFKHTSECGRFTEVFQNNIIAVLAPTPFEMDYEITIPTIFYETPYMIAEYEARFPNSMNLMSGLLLKFAFMKFINNNGWHRIAIISDDTPYAIDFERGMLEKFHEKQIIYNVHRCNNKKHFEKALIYLMSVDARIIIANVNEENARKITAILAPYKSKFTILFRVPPFWVGRKSQWISITLGPSESGYETCKVNKKSACLGIMQSLDIITKAKAEHSNPEDLHRTTFYRKFTKTMMTKIQPGATAYVGRENADISKMHITENGEFKDVVSYRAPFDKEVLDQKDCIAKTNIFSKPCDHSVYLYLMFVIIMFALTLLTITCYFHESSPLLSKSYQQL